MYICVRGNEFDLVSTILPFDVGSFSEGVYVVILFINQIGNVRRLTTYLLYFIQCIQAT